VTLFIAGDVELQQWAGAFMDMHSWKEKLIFAALL
jgi:hypothetical protein